VLVVVEFLPNPVVPRIEEVVPGGSEPVVEGGNRTIFPDIKAAV